MIITSFFIIDFKAEEANSFVFKKGANIISSDRNTVGKSCILKSMSYALGLDVTHFANGWNYNDMFFLVEYELNQKQGYIVRHQDNFWVKDVEGLLDGKQYSTWLMDLLGVKIKIPMKTSHEYQNIYSSLLLALYYIDQDTSWSGVPYRKTTNMEMYNAKIVPKVIFEYLFGIHDDEIIKLEDEKARLEIQKSNYSNQIDVLSELQDEFISEHIESNYDEQNLKNEVAEYLKLANTLSARIANFKRLVYENQIESDAIEYQLYELNKIIKSISVTYQNIDYECTQCHSVLTMEQSISRMKLNRNELDLQRYKSECNPPIK